MNVAEDNLVAAWFEPKSVEIAREDLEVLAQIDESDSSDRAKCEQILDLLHRAPLLNKTRHAVDPATISELRQNLLVKVSHDEATKERLIAFERESLIGASEETVLRAAIERWERSNR
jgi:hypothetical protein